MKGNILFSYRRIEEALTEPYGFRMSLKINIRTIRQGRGLTLADLAGMVGISTPHMSEIERGIKNLNNHLIERLSEALQVPPEALISSDGGETIAKLSSILSKLDERDLDRVEAFARALLQSEEATRQTR